MRFNYPKHEEVAKSTNPALLYSKGIQAFAVVKEYRQALRTEQAHKAQKIREANTDLASYFAYVNDAIKKNPYYEV